MRRNDQAVDVKIANLHTKLDKKLDKILKNCEKQEAQTEWLQNALLQSVQQQDELRQMVAAGTGPPFTAAPSGSPRGEGAAVKGGPLVEPPSADRTHTPNAPDASAGRVSPNPRARAQWLAAGAHTRGPAGAEESGNGNVKRKGDGNRESGAAESTISPRWRQMKAIATVVGTFPAANPAKTDKVSGSPKKSRPVLSQNPFLSRLGLCGAHS